MSGHRGQAGSALGRRGPSRLRGAGVALVVALVVSAVGPAGVALGLSVSHGVPSQRPPVPGAGTCFVPGGRLGSVTDRSAGGVVGRHTDTGYDTVGRPTLVQTYQGAGTATLKLATTTSYLGDGQPAAVAFDGSGSSEGSDTLTFTYDAAGRPDQLKRGSTVLSDLAWNPDGTLASRVDGDAGVLGTTSFAYDWAGRLAATTLPSGWQSGGNSATQAYRLDGLLASRTWNGGTAALFAYDAAKRPTGLAKGSLLALSQAYDRAGNVTAEGRSLTGVSGDPGTGTQSFTYDPFNRVTGFKPAVRYGDDRAGTMSGPDRARGGACRAGGGAPRGSPR